MKLYSVIWVTTQELRPLENVKNKIIKSESEKSALLLLIKDPNISLGRDLLLEFSTGDTNQVTPYDNELSVKLHELDILFQQPLLSDPRLTYGEVSSDNFEHNEFMKLHAGSIADILLKLNQEDSFIRIEEITN